MKADRVIAIEEHFLSPGAYEAAGVKLPGPGIEERALELSEMRLAEMDAARIDVQLLSHAAPGLQAAPVDRALELAVAANDELAVACREHPTRFAGLASIPTTDPERAADELERCVSQLGLKGAVINGTTNGRFLDDPIFYPFLARAEKLDVPIFLHPGPPPPAVVDAYYSDNPGGLLLGWSGWGWHVEAGLHLVRMVLAGVFDRYPSLHMVTGHMGQGIPFMLGRIGDVFEHTVDGLERPVVDYFTENISLGTTSFTDPGPLACVMETFGPDRIMFSVDFPYGKSGELLEQLESAGLEPDDLQKIAYRNAERIFGI